MADAQILARQIPVGQPRSEITQEATSPILSPKPVADRLGHFPPEVYDLRDDSNLVRLAKVLLGDAGIGGVRKRFLLSRLQQTLNGSHFVDLDRFYGVLFALRRRSFENLLVDPAGVATADEWQEAHASDASYRSRIEQFARSITFGASPTGMELAAEALLSVDCDVYESFVLAEHGQRTWGEVEALVGTYGVAETYTYGELEGENLAGSANQDRWSFTIRPKRPITLEEKYDTLRVLRQLKPAFARMAVDEQGVALHVEGSLRAITADSNYWEIRSAVAPQGVPASLNLYSSLSVDGTPVEQPRPPFSAYQGESWSYNGDILGVVGYAQTTDAAETVLPGSDRTRVYYVKNPDPFEWAYIDFVPSMAIKPFQNTQAGRAVADAILVAHPYAHPRTTVPSGGASEGTIAKLTGTLTGVWLDAFYLRSEWERWVKQGIGPNDTQRLWATSERLLADPTREVTEIRYGSPRIVNSVSFQVSHFPHTVKVEIHNIETGGWDKVFETTIRESVPARIEPGWLTFGPFHIQHLLTSHWIPIDEKIGAIETDSVRIVMQRFNGGVSPFDFRGNAMPYSLALKDVDIGYRVDALVDVPRGAGAFAYTLDLLGSPKELSLHEESASGLASGRQWRCEPQPIAQAVVNTYLDARLPSGDGQVFERFWLDPLLVGPHLSLYWSNDDPSGKFLATSDPIPFGVLSITGTVSPEEMSGLNFSGGSASYVDVPNEVLQFDPTKSWCLGMEFLPRWPSVTTQEHTLFSFGPNRLVILNDAISFETDTVIPTVPVAFNALGRVRVGISYDASALTERRIEIYVEADGGGVWTDSITWTLATDFERPDFIRIGGRSEGGAAGPSDFLLSALMLKTGVVPDDLVRFTQAIPRDSVKARFRTDDDGSTDNAILRYHPTQHQDGNPLGWRGGPGDFYANLAWKPVARDYLLQKGYIYVPPIKAKFWKFEFTNLVAQPYESYTPITRTVRTFPIGVAAESTAPNGTIWQTGKRTSLDLLQRPIFQFSDTVIAATGVEIVDTSETGQRTATTALVVQDYDIAQSIAQRVNLLGFQSHQQGTLAPRFTLEGKHEYKISTVAHSSKIGYFVGLRGLKAYRLDYQAHDDTMVYRDHFHDDLNLTTPYTWELDPNRLYTDDTGLPSVATSRVFESAHRMWAIQFATHQNDPVQIIPDDEFRDPALINSDWTDDTQWHSIGDAVLSYSPTDTTVRLSRSAAFAPLETTLDEGMEQPPIHPVFASRTQQGGTSAGLFGGIESPLLTISGAGRILAAVRFKALTALSGPFTLQIINAAGSVLTSMDITTTKNTTVEEYIDYIINSYAAGTQIIDSGFDPPRHLADRPIQPPSHDPPLTYIGSGSPTPDTTGDDQVRVRLVQYGESADSILLDALSLFDESIVWEFSADGGATWITAYGIRNYVNGMLVFPTAGTQLRWRVTGYRENMNVTSLQIRPWYVDRLDLRTSGHHRGPNVSTFDHEPPIEDDPEFTTWWKPVPKTWFLAGKPYPNLPISGETPTNEFSHSFGRSTTEDISGIVQVTTRLVDSARYSYVVYDSMVLPHEVPGDTLPVITDTVSRSGGSFTRSTSEATPTPTEVSSGFIIEFETDPINRPPFGSPT